MLKHAKAGAGVSLLLSGLAAAGAGYSAASHPTTALPHRLSGSEAVRLTRAYLPLAFERNDGQAPAEARYLARSRGNTLLVDPLGATLCLESGTQRQTRRVAANGKPALRRTSPAGTVHTASVRMQLVGGRKSAPVVAAEPLPGHVNYVVGKDPSLWKTNVPTFARVTSHGVYPGVDLAYYGNGKQLEYDFVVHPGADPAGIRVQLTGADRLDVDPLGDLLIHTRVGLLRQERPVAYQEIEGRRQPVAARYELDGEVLAFQVGEFDHTRPLVIDPLLNYSTYLGGSGDDLGTGVGVDGSGNAYVVGTTFSPNFPTVSAAQPSRQGTQDVFVTKLNAAGTAVLYSTYLGGAADETGQGIAVSSAGVATVTGDTSSADFPTLGAAQAAFGGITDAFVTRLTATGAPVYSTFIGGNDSDVGNGVAVDPTGNAYVVGVTSSPSLPGSAPNALVGASDAFVTKLSATGSSVGYSRYIGGGDFDVGTAIDVTASGEAVVVGFTFSANFPRVGAFQNSLLGSNDAFVSRLNAAGSSLQYSTYLGGTGDFDDARAVTLDGDGNAYVTGTTYSADFPINSSFQPVLRGSGEAYVTKLNAAGNSALFSTFLGGTLDDTGDAIRLDSLGRVWIAGETSSPDFPVVTAVQSALGGGLADGFVTCLEASGQSLGFSSYLGGSADDVAYGVAIDAADNLYLAGATASANFPTVQAFQPTSAGGVDAFVVRLGSGPGAPLAPSNLHSTATQSQVSLAWNDNSDNEDHFEIERRTGGLAFSLLGTSATANFIDSAVSQDTTYVYRVRAVNAIGASGFSNEHTVTVPTTLPAAPSNLLAKAITTTRIDLTWFDNSNNETLFLIERKSGNGEFVEVEMVTANTTSYSDTTGLAVNTAYTYRVSALNALGASAPTPLAVVTIESLAKITVSPKKASYGTVKLNKSKDKTITIKNTGKGILHGMVVAPTDPFQIVSGGGSFTILPKKSVKVVVRMFPAEADTYQDSLTVLSTDPAHSQITVSLTGKAK